MFHWRKINLSSVCHLRICYITDINVCLVMCFIFYLFLPNLALDTKVGFDREMLNASFVQAVNILKYNLAGACV